MSNPEEQLALDVRRSYSDMLNRHGYGFQYSVLNLAHELSNSGESSWGFLVSEFPVEVRGAGTRIDFVLRRRGETHFLLLAECKRANPALSNWCFARAPYVYRNKPENLEPVIMEHAEIRYDTVVTADARERWSAHNPCHIGLEVRSNMRGDAKGESGRAIEDACSQVLRGLNGMVDLLFRHRHILANWRRADFLPVIFTTAGLWLSEVELTSAELESGNVDLTRSNFTRQPWVCYQYHQSPGIKHSASPINISSDLGLLIKSEYIRTIPIVSPEGIAPFLRWASELDFIE
ncbi:MAG: hypothetical protein WBP93_04330 [Pyrinomonadaceae bacterium]